MKKHYVVSAFSVLLFRILLSGIFIVAGTSHLLQPAKTSARMANSALLSTIQHLGGTHTLALLSGAVLLVGGIFLLTGIYTRWAAITLLLVLIPITVSVQLGNGLMHGPLWKNIALAGGLIFFIINHSERFFATPATT